jgi:hypothetical protein
MPDMQCMQRTGHLHQRVQTRVVHANNDYMLRNGGLHSSHSHTHTHTQPGASISWFQVPAQLNSDEFKRSIGSDDGTTDPTKRSTTGIIHANLNAACMLPWFEYSLKPLHVCQGHVCLRWLFNPMTFLGCLSGDKHSLQTL